MPNVFVRTCTCVPLRPIPDGRDLAATFFTRFLDAPVKRSVGEIRGIASAVFDLGAGAINSITGFLQ